MVKKHHGLARTAAVIIIISLATTLGSYAIVTGKNVELDPLKEYVTITGDHIINLPCAPVGGDWSSDKPVLPETRGLPLNYHFWNPCEGDRVLLKEFVLDLGFWLFVFSGIYISYLAYAFKAREKSKDKAS